MTSGRPAVDDLVHDEVSQPLLGEEEILEIVEMRLDRLARDGRQRLRHHSKERQELRKHAFHRKSLVRLFDLRADVAQRQVAVDFVHRCANARNERRGIAAGAYFNGSRLHPAQHLSPRAIDRRPDIFTLAGVLRVACETDNLDLAGFVGIETEALANRAFIAEVGLREGLIDDRHRRRVGIVLRVQVAAQQQRNLHRLQKVFSHLVNFCLRFTWFAVWSNFTRDEDVACVAQRASVPASARDWPRKRRSTSATASGRGWESGSG